MEEAIIIVIIVICVIVAILIILFCFWKYCYKDGRFRRPCHEEEGLLPPSKVGPSGKRVFLTKRCEQESPRQIENHILKRLRRDCSVDDSRWGQDLDEGQKPVIVFCVISSRIGTDIESAMRGVHGSSPVVLVVLHCVLRGLIKGKLSDDDDLLDPPIKNRMTGIAHFAFSDDDGLYDCQDNRDGFKKLANLVNSL